MKRRTLQPKERTIEAELKRFLRTCETEGKSDRTIEQYRNSVVRFMKEVSGNINTELIGQDEIEDFTWGLKERLSPGSVNYYLRGLRAFINHLKLDLTVPMVKEVKKQITPFNEKQVRQIFQQINRKTFVGTRDHALLNLLFDTGIRINEAAGIRKKDILPGHVKVTGKGGKERVVPIGSYAMDSLRNYLEHVDDLPNDTPVFVSINNLPLNRHTVNDRIRLYVKKAGIENIRASCHTFRHTFARAYLINGGDMYSLRKILGHETLDMVKEYVELFTHDVIEIHKKHSPSDTLFRRREKKK